MNNVEKEWKPAIMYVPTWGLTAVRNVGKNQDMKQPYQNIQIVNIVGKYLETRKVCGATETMPLILQS